MGDNKFQATLKARTLTGQRGGGQFGTPKPPKLQAEDIDTSSPNVFMPGYGPNTDRAVIAQSADPAGGQTPEEAYQQQIIKKVRRAEELGRGQSPILKPMVLGHSDVESISDEFPEVQFTDSNEADLFLKRISKTKR